MRVIFHGNQQETSTESVSGYGRIRERTRKGKYLLRSSGDTTVSDSESDDSDRTMPKKKRLDDEEKEKQAKAAIVLMTKKIDTMELFTGDESDGWLGAAQRELDSFIAKGVFEEIDP